MLQIFNQINSRKIEGELNVFAGFFNNFLFIFVVTLTVVVQLAMVQIGGVYTKCSPLTTEDNLFCIGIGSLSLVWGLLLKFLPLRLFQCMSLDDKPMEDENLERSFINSMKRSSTLKMKQRAAK
jgi:Ca2+ transporting ATPase